jgi:translation initiation factor 2 subunit 2
MTEEKDNPVSTEPTLDETEEFTFDMSIKKKKKKKKPTEAETEEVKAEPSETVLPTEDGGITFTEEAGITETTSTSTTTSEAWLGSDRDYTYAELLGRVFSILRQNNPDLAGDRRKFTIIPPIIGREGSKKTAFTNIAELCRRMRRPVEHVTSFLLTEIGTTGSTDANQRLIIKGRLQQLQIENLLRRYISEYVTCKTCRSPETQLFKENRLFFMKCDSCGSSRSVAAIKAGFKAQTGRRVRAG